MSAPMSSYPHGVRSGPNAVMAADPHPTTTNANRPAARHADVVGTRSHRDDLHLRWRWSLLCDHWPCRSTRLRRHINNLPFNTAGSQGEHPTHSEYE